MVSVDAHSFQFSGRTPMRNPFDEQCQGSHMDGLSAGSQHPYQILASRTLTRANSREPDGDRSQESEFIRSKLGDAELRTLANSDHAHPT